MRKNKNTGIVFCGLPGKLTKFIDDAIQTDPHLERYQRITESIDEQVKELEDLEEVILQVKAWHNLDKTKIKITQTRDYIYVRAPFYRRDNVAKEIRVIVGKAETFTNSQVTYEDLYEFDMFMELSVEKLKTQMHDVIQTNVEAYKNKYETIKIK